jgi:hypothetical protein
MKSSKSILAGVLAAGLVAGCGGSDSSSGDGFTRITTDTTWSADTVHRLRGLVFVTNGATLTIEAGTRIEGDRGSALVVTTEGRIDAQGTDTNPIVFTSSQPEGTRLSGDWGGVVLLGKAEINVSGGTNAIEGIPSSVAGTTYGGNDNTHDCGTMKYVRIEFAGYKLGVDNELNGLTVGACGSQTALEFIQVHLGNDDGIEFFGGTANLKHALITLPDDDGLDWDYGFSGKVQFLVVQQDANHGDKGFESDNNPAGDTTAPISNPTVYNVTLVGSNANPGGPTVDGGAYKKQGGTHLRNGTKGTIRNALFTGFSDLVIDVDGTVSAGYANDGTLSVKNSLFYGNPCVEDVGGFVWPDPKPANDCPGGTCLDETAVIANDATNVNLQDPQLTNAFSVSAPDFRPAAGSPALAAGAGATPPNDGFFDVTATYIGAFDDVTDWTAGWAAFPAN